MTRNHTTRNAAMPEDRADLRRQTYIFLWTFTLTILLLISLYLQLSWPVTGGAALLLTASTMALFIKYKDFYALRDRGQRTWCVTISMYCSLILTLSCAYYFSLDEPLTLEYALVFLFGYMFFVYMVYRTLSTTMVVGNTRRRIKR
ncbi:hypothetical protein AB840_07200 [Megasphaera cerevisiae DSM 20462]|jgi:hypothetical protein|uniref:Permease n=1 Tax=Megasphaera cerevisiae DSM 20462 TaxID=1122219 RepID=A0A0J6WWL3_9FIRM|nr:hypothetical protein [Megasphaera cerevisiae]KMO86588.1 hypothetical protein AB840_07200 [Megasphaera cerevisiae DSM 20462]OKY53276.1 hypothetical protein BSR42_08520 [Megasphaera cerevisiae]SJZ69465.1 hypothetical protein SAMN05660900_01191 [Megasphaera cerevisiae DSM 20462]